MIKEYYKVVSLTNMWHKNLQQNISKLDPETHKLYYIMIK
jgi:hypothetical protein